MKCDSPSAHRSAWLATLAIGLLAFLLAASRINHGITNSILPAGPGLTPDESFNVQQGVYLAEAFFRHGPLLLHPDVADEVFDDRVYLPDHPPLGRFFIGLTHELTRGFISGTANCPFNILAARLASCAAFALTVVLVYRFCRIRFDLVTAITAAALLMSMPRVVGHARLAALESTTGLMWWIATVALAAATTDSERPGIRKSAFAGCAWGLLLLTKVQAILFPPVVVIFLVARFRRNAIVPLIVFFSTGLLVGFLGWPWIWQDPWHHTLQYLGHAADRQTLHVWYLGHRWLDKTAPWHYPLVMLWATTPLLASFGVAARAFQRRFTTAEGLLILTAIFPLIVFALPGVPVYDGVRLFLVAAPATAVLSARGLTLLWQSLSNNKARRHGPWQVLKYGGLALAAVLFLTDAAATLSPYAISRYTAGVGRGPGAERLQLESSYWADGLNADFWKQIPEGSEVFVAPVSHQFQLTDLENLVPVIQERSIRLSPFEYDSREQRGFLLLIHRLADLRPSLQSPPSGSEVLVTVESDGRVLAQLVDTTHATWVERP